MPDVWTILDTSTEQAGHTLVITEIIDELEVIAPDTPLNLVTD